MFIDPPEGCKGPPINLDNVLTYDVMESPILMPGRIPNQSSWHIAFAPSVSDGYIGWAFDTEAAALEGMAYIKELRDNPLVQVMSEPLATIKVYDQDLP